MRPLFWNTSRLLFGTGSTQGGVKKVVVAKIDYDRWAVKEGTRALLASAHHPLVLEYFVRLNDKRVALEKWMESSTNSSSVTALTNKIDSSPFNHVQWNVIYRDELDVAEKMSGLLRQLDENVTLRDQLAAKQDATTNDKELLEIVKEEIADLVSQVTSLNDEVDPVMEKRLNSEDIVGSSSNTWTITVSGKAGGEEASLFAAELAEMFRVYATEFRDLKVQIIPSGGSSASGDAADESIAAGTIGENKFRVIGVNVYRFFHHEIGVHKVQRVPVTDSAGKMQTSTAVFTMMPELNPVSVDVHESDCKIDFVRGSGPGGQGMQSSSNCVVLTHKPSGISVKCHQSRSALGNKELALQMVAQQILSERVKDQKSSLYEAWKNQWSSGERSDKMRTYNYPQNRVTDHRIGKDFPLQAFMERGFGLKQLHDELNSINDQQQLSIVLLKHIDGDFGSTV